MLAQLPGSLDELAVSPELQEDELDTNGLLSMLQTVNKISDTAIRVSNLTKASLALRFFFMVCTYVI